LSDHHCADCAGQRSPDTNDYAHALLALPDSKILVAGETTTPALTTDFALARLLPGGGLDATFGVGGKVTTAFGPSGDELRGLELQPDGKIVAAGYADTAADINTQLVFAMARYLPNGMLDATCDGDGKVTVPVGLKGHAEAQDVAIQSDGKILLTGHAKGPSADWKLAAARFTATCARDPAFNGIGQVMTNFGPGPTNDEGYEFALDASGRIVMVGRICGMAVDVCDFGVLRYLPNGVPDASSSGDGKVVTSMGVNTTDSLHAVAIQSDGRIVVAGKSDEKHIAVARSLP
jgi:uncharacterized delta-60 repeat protein